jgi:hypothetical protein
MKISAITLLSLISLNSMAIENRPWRPRKYLFAEQMIQTHEVKFDFNQLVFLRLLD